MERFWSVVAVLVGIQTSAAAQQPAAKPAPRVTVLRSNAGFPALSPDGATLAFEGPGKGGYRAVYTMPVEAAPDAESKCLTCDSPALPGKHAGHPAWHPQGRYLAIQAEKKSVPTELDRRAMPATGLLNDIYLLDTETGAGWLLVRLPLVLNRDTPATLAPRFTPDGTTLVWAQRILTGGPRLGTWELRQANFVFTKTGPVVEKIRTIPVTGAPAFHEPEGFDPTGKLLLFSSSLNKASEVFTVGLDGGTPKALTTSQRTWDFAPAFSPDGKRIAWASSQSLRYQPDPFEVETDFWVMNADGSGKHRLTDFHKGPEAALLTGKVRMASDTVWTPDGKALIGLVQTGEPGTPQFDSGTLVRVRVE